MLNKNGDNRLIGVFDSGLGGLTAVTYLSKLLPNERFIYFGDTARTPYGSKDIDTIKKFSIQIADFLINHNVKAIVIACNTVSSVCIDILKHKYPTVPIIGIISPAAETISKQFGTNENVGIIGTKVTINSKQYDHYIEKFNGKCSITSMACPLFVPAIEEGIGNTEVMEMLVRHYLDSFIIENNIRVMVLGCTHYPLIEGVIRKLYPDLEIVNPSEIVAYEVAKVLKENNLEAKNSDKDNIFFASDLSDGFARMIKTILPGQKANIHFKKFEEDLENV